MRDLLSRPLAPLVALALVLGLGLAARLSFLSTPQALIFDEHYYVSAAERMLGMPAAGRVYSDSPAGVDPNGAHPGLGKLAIAAGIELLGDRPLGWRLPSVIFGMAALLGLYALSRAAGSSRWTAVGAVGLAAVDPLLLVHSRIGTLDIFAVTFMILAVASWARGRPVLSGVLIGLAVAAKLVAVFALVVIALLALFQAVVEARERTADRRSMLKKGGSLLLASAIAAVVLIAVTYLYDRAFYPTAGPVDHLVSMVGDLSTGGPDPSVASLRSPDAGTGAGGGGEEFTVGRQTVRKAPLARPVEWLVNREPIHYYGLRSSRLAREEGGPGYLINFTAIINPAVIFTALPALAYCAVSAWRRRDSARFVPVAWFAGTYGPFLAADLTGITHRGFIYYMLLVLPGMYVAVATLFSQPKIRVLAPVVAVAALVWFWIYFPYRRWMGV